MDEAALAEEHLHRLDLDEAEQLAQRCDDIDVDIETTHLPQGD